MNREAGRTISPEDWLDVLLAEMGAEWLDVEVERRLAPYRGNPELVAAIERDMKFEFARAEALRRCAST